MADGALLDAPVEVEQLVDVDCDALAEALAGGAHAVGMIEREAVRPVDERSAAAREEHPQVGVDLGDRADGAAAAGPEALLVDDDAGGDVADCIDRRPGELRQPPAGVGAERLDELALRLGADRVEDERRLAAAAHAGEGDEPVLRNVDINALEVVGAGASDLDGGHRASSSLTGALVQPRQLPFGGADDRACQSGGAERVAGYRARGPSRRDAEAAMVCAFLARFFSGVPPSSSGLLPPHLLHSRGRFGSASAPQGLTPGIGRGEWGRTPRARRSPPNSTTGRTPRRAYFQPASVSNIEAALPRIRRGRDRPLRPVDSGRLRGEAAADAESISERAWPAQLINGNPVTLGTRARP